VLISRIRSILREQMVQQPEVATSDSDDRRDYSPEGFLRLNVPHSTS
jgi:hypothetical protein